jgi:hypothetical protein
LLKAEPTEYMIKAKLMAKLNKPTEEGEKLELIIYLSMPCLRKPLQL